MVCRSNICSEWSERARGDENANGVQGVPTAVFRFLPGSKTPYITRRLTLIKWGRAIPATNMTVATEVLD